MEITIKCDAKEIAAFVFEVQKRRAMEDLAEDVAIHLQTALDQNEPVYQP